MTFNNALTHFKIIFVTWDALLPCKYDYSCPFECISLKQEENDLMNINKCFKFLVRFVHDGYNLFKRYEKNEFK